MVLTKISNHFLAEANTVITANEAVRDGRIIPLKAMVDEAVEGCDCVKQVFVAQRTSANVPMYGRDIPMEQVISNSASRAILTYYGLHLQTLNLQCSEIFRVYEIWK